MDIEYLLWLQNLREASGNFFTPLMRWASSSLPDLMFFAVIFVYWCVSKRKGIFVLFAFSLSYFYGEVMKMIFCVPRPYLKDTRITPYNSKQKDYSFPSGHSVRASSLGGGLAVISRKKALWFSCICVILMLLVAFSRNYLGFHTPQDVLTGLLLGGVSLWLSSIVFSKPERENIMFAVILAVTVLCLYYLCVKSYPADIEEKELRNEIKYIFGDVGRIAGLIFGRIIERKYINFPDGLNFKRVVFAAAGLGIYSLSDSMLKKSFIRFVTPFITVNGGNFLYLFLLMFFVTALWPMVIKKFCSE